jgi:hypothetical protein
MLGLALVLARTLHLCTTESWLFGLVGATRAGTLADRGKAQVGHWYNAHPICRLVGADRQVEDDNSNHQHDQGVRRPRAGQFISVTNQLLIVAIDRTASSQLIGGNTVCYAVGTGGGAIAATIVWHMGLERCLRSRSQPERATALLIWAGDPIPLPTAGTDQGMTV